MGIFPKVQGEHLKHWELIHPFRNIRVTRTSELTSSGGSQTLNLKMWIFQRVIALPGNQQILTYPTLDKEKSSSKVPFGRGMLVFEEGYFTNLIEK